MSAEVTLQGNLGSDATVRYTQDGTPIVELSVAATPSTKNKQTGQWEDIGDPLWVRVSFFGDSNLWLGDLLRKGMKVSCTGTLVLRSWAGQDGQNHSGLELRFPRFLGYQRREDRQAQGNPQNGAQRPAQAPQQSAWGEAPF